MFNDQIRARLTLRDSDPQLYQELEQRMPLVSSHPNASAQAQGMATPGQVQQTAQNVQGMAPQAVQVPGVAPTGQEGQQPPSQLGSLVSKLLEDLNKDNAKKAKPIGPDLMGNGGLLGTGISPSTALMYAIGGLITSRLPQDQALAMTMKIGGLPGEYEAQKAKLAESQVGSILSGINAQTAQGNLQARDLELRQKTAEAARKQKFFDSIDTSSGVLTPQQKLQGVLNGVLPASMLTTDVDYVDTIQDGQKFKVVTNKQTGQPVVDAQGRPTLFPQGPAQTTTRTITPTELKLFADTGIRGQSIPADMSREAAKSAVMQDEARQIRTAGGRAGAVAQATPLTGEVAEKTLQFNTFVDLLERLEKNFDKSFTGPVRGRTYGLARQGITGFTKPSEKEAQFRADLENAKSILVLVRSGAAAAEPEFARLGGIIGEPTDAPEQFIATVKNMLKQGRELRQERTKIQTTPKGQLGGGTSKSRLQNTIEANRNLRQIDMPPGAGQKVE